MSEYCHHCGTHISEDTEKLCPACVSKPDTVRREEIDEFAEALKKNARPVWFVDGKPTFSGLNGAALASVLRWESENHQTVHQEDRERKAILAMAADTIDSLIDLRRNHLDKIRRARERYVLKEKGVDTAGAMYAILLEE